MFLLSLGDRYGGNKQGPVVSSSHGSPSTHAPADGHRGAATGAAAVHGARAVLHLPLERLHGGAAPPSHRTVVGLIPARLLGIFENCAFGFEAGGCRVLEGPAVTLSNNFVVLGCSDVGTNGGRCTSVAAFGWTGRTSRWRESSKYVVLVAIVIG